MSLHVWYSVRFEICLLTMAFVVVALQLIPWVCWLQVQRLDAVVAFLGSFRRTGDPHTVRPHMIPDLTDHLP